MPGDEDGNVNERTLEETSDRVLPKASPSDPDAALVNVSVGTDGPVTATFADGSNQMLGKIAMASFPAMEGLRPIGDAHWQSTGESGAAVIDSPGSGAMGAVQIGRAHV